MPKKTSQPTALVDQTERSTRLGYVLQGVVEYILRESCDESVQITGNAEYAKDIIRPDVIIGKLSKPDVSFHVTCSDNRDSFRMKRWRYVCELFQLKGHHRNVCSVNLVFGNRNLYQPGDLTFLQRIFDQTLDLTNDPLGEEIFDSAVGTLDKAISASKAARKIVSSLSSRKKSDFIRPLLEIINKKGREVKDIWKLPVVRRIGGSTISSDVCSDFRAAFLRGLLLEEDSFSLLKQFVQGEIAKPPQAAIDVGLIRLIEEMEGDRYDGRVGLPDIFSDTLISLRRLVLLNANIERLVSEARGVPQPLKWTDEAFQLFGRQPSKSSVKACLLLAKDHPRELFIDMLVAGYDCSANSLESLWDHSITPVGIKNPIANIVSKTGFIDLPTDELCKGLCDVWQKLEKSRSNARSNSIHEFLSRLIAYRRYCLTKGSIVNPLDYLTSTSIEALGYEAIGKKRFVSSTIEGSPIATEFLHTFSNPLTGRKFAVKNLYGDTGADHKAEEMAGRLFLIPYRLTIRGVSSNKDQESWDYVFVPEGYWVKAQLDLLVSAGWYVVGGERLKDGLIGFVGDPVVVPAKAGRRVKSVTHSSAK